MNAITRQRDQLRSWLRALRLRGWVAMPKQQSAPGADEEHSAERYVRLLLQSSAVFRFFAFAMGVGLTWSLPSGDLPSVTAFAVLAVTGIYNIARIVLQFNPVRHGPLVQGVGLASDLALGLSLVLLTGGLDSAFLIYSLAPILTASLLMSGRAAGATAVVSALAVVVPHLPTTPDFLQQSSVLTGNYLAFALLYAAACLLVFYLPFFANLNWERRIRGELRTAEYQRLRREVHDNVAQTLAYLTLKLNRAEERAVQDRIPMSSRDLMEITSIVERCYLSVRDYLDGATDPAVGEPLSASIHKACQQWRQSTGLRATVTVMGKEPELPPQVRYQLSQIAREALANVAKHAGTWEARVLLDCTPTQVVLRIRDAGKGFISSQAAGHGLAIMSERAAMIGAAVTVDTAPGRGTEVTATYTYTTEKVAP